MLQVRLDEYAADGTAHLDKGPAAEHEATGAQPAVKPRLVDDLHLSQVAAILRRRSALILTIAGIGTMLAAVVGLLIPPKYTAMAQLVIDPPAVNAERAPGVSAIDESIDTHVTLLSSRDHLQRVIKSLWQDPEFRSAARNTVDLEPTPGASPGAQRPAALDQPNGSTVTETIGLSELKRRLNVWLEEFHWSGRVAVPSLEQFERNTKVIQERRSRVISVGYTSASPEKAAAFANRIVQLYVDDLTEQKQADAIRELARLDERIAEAKYEMERAGAAVQKAIQQKPSSDQNASSEERAADGQLRELLLHAGSSAQHYDRLLQSRKELRAKQETGSSGVGNVLLTGVPKRPSSHNPILFILPAFIVFAIGGSWLAVILERLDRGLRSQQEAADALGISCVGLVPQLLPEHAIRPDQHLLTEPFSAYSEAIRSVVGTLGLSGSTRSSKVVLISSSVSGEGKSTLALSIAAYIGALGRRVLLVDLDLRRDSRLGWLDHTTARQLVDLPLQNRPPAELIRHIAGAGIDYLPTTGCRRHPLALFASEEMPGLVRQFRERYDCVIIDGPPVFGAAEARLLPSIADKLLMVVKWGSTRREVAQNAMSMLYDSGCLNKDCSDRAAAIVTQVDLKKHARYRYGDVGEFLAKHGEYSSRSIGDTGDKNPIAGANERLLAIPSSLLHTIIPMGRMKIEDLKIKLPSRPKLP
jgi:succinoglycan biosynthesis transport protein ExoP